jgi:hypothetical protein
MIAVAVLAAALAVGGWFGLRYSETRKQLDVDFDWLARKEADRDVWEPDELWVLQHQRLTDAATPLACVSVTPAAAGTTSAGSAGGGGHLRDELIEQLVDEYRTKLNNWFRP